MTFSSSPSPSPSSSFSSHPTGHRHHACRWRRRVPLVGPTRPQKPPSFAQPPPPCGHPLQTTPVLLTSDRSASVSGPLTHFQCPPRSGSLRPPPPLLQNYSKTTWERCPVNQGSWRRSVSRSVDREGFGEARKSGRKVRHSPLVSSSFNSLTFPSHLFPPFPLLPAPRRPSSLCQQWLHTIGDRQRRPRRNGRAGSRCRNGGGRRWQE